MNFKTFALSAVAVVMLGSFAMAEEFTAHMYPVAPSVNNMPVNPGFIPGPYQPMPPHPGFIPGPGPGPMPPHPGFGPGPGHFHPGFGHCPGHFHPGFGHSCHPFFPFN